MEEEAKIFILCLKAEEKGELPDETCDQTVCLDISSLLLLKVCVPLCVCSMRWKQLCSPSKAGTVSQSLCFLYFAVPWFPWATLDGFPRITNLISMGSISPLLREQTVSCFLMEFWLHSLSAPVAEDGSSF
jgi:hypothetical protein